LVQLLNTISTQYQQQLPFVIYRKPNEKGVSAFLMRDADLTFTTNFQEKGFVFAPFSDSEKAILFREDQADFVSEELLTSAYNFKNIELESFNVSKEKYLKTVEKAIDQIISGHLKKVVISREELVSVDNFSVIEIYEKLLLTYKNAFVYAWFHPKVGLWFGATPETLLSINGTDFRTMSLAGTQVYKEHEKAVWKSKELEEQQLVTTFIEQQLATVATNLEVEKRETIKAGNLLHLRTKVSGSLKAPASLKELIRVLHPTPAICGLPREAARNFIFENEKYDRSFYTGFLGELNLQHSKEQSKTSALFVNLRCMKIKNKFASVYVGGGITRDSDAEKEWEETVLKTKTMKCAL
jgi:isochorismate synthase